VCRTHGGKAPQVEAAAERARRDAEAARAVERLTLRRDIDPATALLEEVQRAAGAVAYIEVRIVELDPHGLVWGQTQTRDGYQGENRVSITVEGPGLNEWIRWWHIERDKLVKASAAAIAADCDTRQVRLAEAQGALLVEAISGILDDLALTTQQRALVAAVVPRHLRIVGGRAG
jgi:hypothetical protein